MPSKAAASAPAAEPLYPHIEKFIENATPSEVDAFFGEIDKGLSALKGPKAEHAKKAKAAIQNAQELLGYLLEVRERLSAERQGGKAKK